MLLHLLDNGLNSLEVGLDFYSKFLFEDEIDMDLNTYYGSLKFAVIGIQNAVELIIKKLLSNINNLLIYEMNTIENPDVLKYMGDKYRNNDKIHLDYFFAFYEDKFSTISYSKCIERFSLCYEIADREIQVLKKLGYYRNILIHFGIEDIYGYYKIMINLNNTLEIIKDRFIPLLNKKRKYVEDKYIENIIYFLENAENKVYETWLASNEHVINIFDEFINNLINDKSLLEQEFGIIAESNFRHIEEYGWISDININFASQGSLDLNIKHVPELDISILLQNESIFAFVDYDCLNKSLEKLDVFIPRKALEFKDIINLQTKIWNDDKDKEYNKIEFNNKAIISNYKKKFLV